MQGADLTTPAATAAAAVCSDDDCGAGVAASEEGADLAASLAGGTAPLSSTADDDDDDDVGASDGNGSELVAAAVGVCVVSDLVPAFSGVLGDRHRGSLFILFCPEILMEPGWFSIAQGLHHRCLPPRATRRWTTSPGPVVVLPHDKLTDEASLSTSCGGMPYEGCLVLQSSQRLLTTFVEPSCFCEQPWHQRAFFSDGMPKLGRFFWQSSQRLFTTSIAPSWALAQVPHQRRARSDGSPKLARLTCVGRG